MSDVAALIADMVVAGVDPQIIGRTAALLVCQAAVHSVDEAAERRRAKDRERKRQIPRKSAESAESPSPSSEAKGFPGPLPKTQPSIPNPHPPIAPPLPAGPASLGGDFEAAWKAYPHVKGRSSKPKTLAAWKALNPADRSILAGAAARYRAEGREPKADCGAPAMERWVRDQRFVDWRPKPSPTGANPPPEVLQSRIQHYRDTHEWRPAWGPMPKEIAA